MRRFEVHYTIQYDGPETFDVEPSAGDPYKGVVETGRLEFFAKDWAEAMVSADYRLAQLSDRFVTTKWNGPFEGVLEDKYEIDYYNRNYRDGDYQYKAMLTGYFREWVPDEEEED